MQVANLVRDRHPGMEVVGTNYPVPFGKAVAAKVVTGAQMTLLATVFFGEKLFQVLGVPTPQFYTTNMAPNRMQWGLGAWIAGNMLSQNLQNTGAFEIYWDGQLVFSKLRTKRMPGVDELWSGLHAAMRKSGYPVDEEGAPQGLPHNPRHPHPRQRHVDSHHHPHEHQGQEQRRYPHQEAGGEEEEQEVL